MSRNRVEIEGKLNHLEAIRYTPAGVPIVTFSIEHQSEQLEAGVQRSVSCHIQAMALGGVAEKVARVRGEANAKCSGFIAMKNLKSSQLVLHVTSIEFS